MAKKNLNPFKKKEAKKKPNKPKQDKKTDVKEIVLKPLLSVDPKDGEFKLKVTFVEPVLPLLPENLRFENGSLKEETLKTNDEGLNYELVVIPESKELVNIYILNVLIEAKIELIEEKPIEDTPDAPQVTKVKKKPSDLDLKSNIPSSRNQRIKRFR
jgi:hypothetical protein